MTKYRLLKDLPGYEAGFQVTYDHKSESISFYSDDKFRTWFITFVNANINNPEWFEKIEDPKPVNPILWKPEKGESYYLLDNDGDIVDTTYERWAWDNDRYAIGNMYQTESEAQKALDRRLAYVELIRAIAEANGDWKPDWSDDNRKWFFDCDADGELGYNFVWGERSVPPELYMESEEVTNQISVTLGEAKIKLAMGWE